MSELTKNDLLVYLFFYQYETCLSFLFVTSVEILIELPNARFRKREKQIELVRLYILWDFFCSYYLMCTPSLEEEKKSNN